MVDNKRIEKYVVGPIATNCYFLINEDTKEALVIDPGGDSDFLISSAKEMDLKIEAILLTHGHFDHADAAEEIRKNFSSKIFLFYLEEDLLKDPMKNLSAAMLGKPKSYSYDILLKDNEEREIAGFNFKTLHAPGHTPGGCGFYFPDERILFSGDTLFYCSVGRSDFPGGSMVEEIKSVKERFFTLPDETRVFPGHGEETTIGFEKENNMYV